MKQHEIIEIREKVLKKIRNSLMDNDGSIDSIINETSSSDFVDNNTALPILFAERFTEAGGFFYYADNKEELKKVLNSILKELKYHSVYCSNDNFSSLILSDVFAISSNSDDLPTVQAVVSECEFLCARTGSILMSSYLSAGRRGIATNNALIIIANQNQILADIDDALSEIHKKYKGKIPSQLTFVTGPSRTADIEKQLIMGAHGSIEVYVFIYDE